MKTKHAFIVFLIFSIALSACGPNAEEMAATSVAETDEAATAAVTDTPTPTATPTLTPTPTPTLTPTQKPSATPAEPGSVVGRVYWTGNDAAIAGIVIEFGGKQITTEADGKFGYYDLEPGVYVISIFGQLELNNLGPCEALNVDSLLGGLWNTSMSTVTLGNTVFLLLITGRDIEVKAGEEMVLDIAFRCHLPNVTPTAISKSEQDVVSQVGHDYGMTFYAQSGRYGLTFEDGSVLSLMDEEDVYAVTWSVQRESEMVVYQVVANRLLTLISALGYPESMFQTIADDLLADWPHYNVSPNYEEHYEHDGYEIVIYEDETSFAFDPTHPFNEGGFHIVIRMKKPE